MTLQPELTQMLIQLEEIVKAINYEPTVRHVDIAELLTRINEIKQPLVGVLLARS